MYTHLSEPRPNPCGIKVWIVGGSRTGPQAGIPQAHLLPGAYDLHALPDGPDRSCPCRNKCQVRNTAACHIEPPPSPLRQRHQDGRHPPRLVQAHQRARRHDRPRRPLPASRGTGRFTTDLSPLLTKDRSRSWSRQLPDLPGAPVGTRQLTRQTPRVRSKTPSLCV
jgi:hypothetical protein